MKKSQKNIKLILLNLTIMVSLIILSFITVVYFQRWEDQKNYNKIVKVRNLQSELQIDPLISFETSTDSLFPESYDQTHIQYTITKNPNLKWVEINNDYMGWIKIPETKIDYPFVRSADNHDYLTLDFYKEYSETGSLFMDYRNIGNFYDDHMIIYGHYMKNKTMFHNLTYFHDLDFLKAHNTIEISGLYENKIYTIFSVYEISADDYRFTLDFETQESYLSYIELLNSKSMHDLYSEEEIKQFFNTNNSTDDVTLLTLVTCSYGVENGRTIVHALSVSP